MSEPSLYSPPANLAASAPVNPNTVSDSEGVATVSPTGTPRVAPDAVKWVLAAGVGLAAGLEVAAESLPNPLGRTLCRIGALAIGAFVGAASPGFRKAQ